MDMPVIAVVTPCRMVTVVFFSLTATGKVLVDIFYFLLDSGLKNWVMNLFNIADLH